MRFTPLPLILIGTPLAEIVAFGLVVQWIGFWSALGLLLLTSGLGLLIVRHQGFGLISKLSSLAREGRPPINGIGGDLVTLLSGLLLLAPGFITDVAGLVLLLPLVRNRLTRKSIMKTRVFTERGYTESYEYRSSSRSAEDGRVVDLDDADFRREDDERNSNGSDRLSGR
jgi:UPF0716 protein FxsA